jgi:CO/xanthine dehydrogenase Mo-binding subunit
VTQSDLPFSVSRRSVLRAGALTVAFALGSRAFGRSAAARPQLDGSLKSAPWLNAWIRVDHTGRITVFTGKAELGQGIRTALTQVAAEELDVSPHGIELITADTRRTPDEGLTAGSHSMQDSGTAIRNAAANVRMLLIQAAAVAWRADTDAIATTGQGEVSHRDGRRMSYGDLATTFSLQVEAIADVPLRDPARFRTMGTSMSRVDLPAKLTGGPAFLNDLRPIGMLHARVVRGPSEGTRLRSLEVVAVIARPGVVKVIQAGTFTAVVAEQEWTAITAMRDLQRGPFVRSAPTLAGGDLFATFKSLPAQDILVLDTRDEAAEAVHTIKARYSRPWLSHGSIGPSSAIAHFDRDLMTVWTHSQGIFQLRRVIAELLCLPPEQVHVIHAEGAGCYGQNGADDVAADAAFIARALPGRPIRLQWMREQEFGWEPLGPPMATELEAALDANQRIVSWRHEIWSNRHNNRPQQAGAVWIGGELTPPFRPQQGAPIPMPEGDGDRNSNPLYTLPNVHVVFHYLPDMPVRVSALRSLGAHVNVFSIESMMDELAKAGALDPLALRLSHMRDPRAAAVMQAAADGFGWSKRVVGDGCRGCGMGFARYKNSGAYCSVVMKIELDRDSGHIAVRRVAAAVDAGLAVNPDGIRNQIEGGIIQALSWTSCEAVTFDADGRTSIDWNSYPILRFSHAPDSIEVHIVDRPNLPFLGVAEAAQGPAAAALGNAFADATGIRMRDMPLSPVRVRAAISVTSMIDEPPSQRTTV